MPSRVVIGPRKVCLGWVNFGWSINVPHAAFCSSWALLHSQLAPSKWKLSQSTIDTTEMTTVMWRNRSDEMPCSCFLDPPWRITFFHFSWILFTTEGEDKQLVIVTCLWDAVLWPVGSSRLYFYGGKVVGLLSHTRHFTIYMLALHVFAAIVLVCQDCASVSSFRSKCGVFTKVKKVAHFGSRGVVTELSFTHLEISRIFKDAKTIRNVLKPWIFSVFTIKSTQFYRNNWK